MNGEAQPLIGQAETSTPPPSDEHLAQRLAALIDGAPALAPAAAGSTYAGENGAAGVSPTHWTSHECAQLSERLFSDPAIVYAQHPGVTRSRLRAILPDYRKAEAEQVLHWLAAARVLAPPIIPDAPFRHPRSIICSTATELAERLAATPYPLFVDEPAMEQRAAEAPT